MSLHFPALDQPAPAFSTLNQHQQPTQLSDYLGKKVVLYFYPKAMTPGCTIQACGLQSTHAALAEHNAIVLGVSPDAPARLLKFAEKYQLDFPLLSDEDHRIAEAYGAWALKKFMGKEYVGIHRITFLIDEQGVLRHIMKKVTTKTHHDDVLALLPTL